MTDQNTEKTATVTRKNTQTEPHIKVKKHDNDELQPIITNTYGAEKEETPSQTATSQT